MRLDRGIVIGLGFILSSSAFAADAGAIIKLVEEKYSKVTTMKAKFTQTVHNPMFGDESQEGDLTLKRPKKMLWNFTSGPKKQFVSDGQAMWVWSQAENQVVKYDNIADKGSDADALLTSLDKLDELFLVSLDATDTVGHTLDLTPKKAGNVKKIHLELSPELIVEKVIVNDAFDNITSLTFSNVKLNSVIEDSTFVFIPPKGAEIISAGGK